MSEEEILRYIFSCVCYKHVYDLSTRITKAAQKQEDLSFSSAVYFLRGLGKGKNVFVEEIEPDDRFEVTEEGKEYLSSH